MRLYVEDLNVLQRHTEHYFPIPEEIPATERIALRMARLVIEGHCVTSPFVRTLTVTLNGTDTPEVRTLLGGEPQSLWAATDEFAVSLAGRSFGLGPVHVSHPEVVADSGHQALAALDAGRADGCRVVLRPANGEHFRLQIHASDSEQPPAPVPLGLDGYTDPC